MNPWSKRARYASKPYQKDNGRSPLPFWMGWRPIGPALTPKLNGFRFQQPPWLRKLRTRAGAFSASSRYGPGNEGRHPKTDVGALEYIVIRYACRADSSFRFGPLGQLSHQTCAEDPCQWGKLEKRRTHMKSEMQYSYEAISRPCPGPSRTLQCKMFV